VALPICFGGVTITLVLSCIPFVRRFIADSTEVLYQWKAGDGFIKECFLTIKGSETCAFGTAEKSSSLVLY
jgi:hypothetical protein